MSSSREIAQLSHQSWLILNVTEDIHIILKQETLPVVTIATICSILASLW